MELNFVKYQGTGNDFVMLDCYHHPEFQLSLEQVRQVCNRKSGVGADGLIELRKHNTLDFELVYYNADASMSFCGNGARCAVAFAWEIGIKKKEYSFMAIDGVHHARLENGEIELEMLPVHKLFKNGDAFVLNTGSPHYVRLVEENEMPGIVDFGRTIRYSKDYAAEGINVNLMRIVAPGKLYVETYERGVEDETLSCGTGVTACALVYQSILGNERMSVDVKTKGGDLSVKSELDLISGAFSSIVLKGPAKRVFYGTIEL